MNESRISLLCPSRERPHLLNRLITSINNTAYNPRALELCIYIDENDPTALDVERMIIGHQLSSAPNIIIRLLVGPQKSVSVCWNDLAALCTGDILMMVNDDQVCITKYWDQRIREEAAKYPDEIYLLFVHDRVHNTPSFCAFPIVSRTWYETLGYFTPGCFQFLYNDTWISDLGDRIGRKKKITDVIIEHRHWTTPMGKADGLVERTISKETWKADDALFNSEAMVQRRKDDAEKLRRKMRL